jgi:hypothetical protein
VNADTIDIGTESNHTITTDLPVVNRETSSIPVLSSSPLTSSLNTSSTYHNVSIDREIVTSSTSVPSNFSSKLSSIKSTQIEDKSMNDFLATSIISTSESSLLTSTPTLNQDFSVDNSEKIEQVITSGSEIEPSSTIPSSTHTRSTFFQSKSNSTPKMSSENITKGMIYVFKLFY